MKKLAIIGCGGINSWVIKHLFDIIETFDKKDLMFIKLFDKDEIEEKNLLRQNQNFEIEDLTLQKAEVLAKRYKFDFNNTFISEDNIDLLQHFDHIIVGVDNNKTRRMLYKYAIDNNKYLLDLKAQGTQMAFVILDTEKDIKYYDEKYFSNLEVMERKGSCQLQTDVDNDHIENANKIIAHFGIYGIYLKKLRGEEPTTKEWRFVY